MEKSDKHELRRDEETGLPIFIIVNQIKKFCHHHIQEQTEDGDIISVKLRPTQKFMAQLNERVIELLEESINHARNADRMDLMVEDVPSFNGHEEEEDTD